MSCEEVIEFDSDDDSDSDMAPTPNKKTNGKVLLKKAPQGETPRSRRGGGASNAIESIASTFSPASLLERDQARFSGQLQMQQMGRLEEEIREMRRQLDSERETRIAEARRADKAEMRLEFSNHSMKRSYEDESRGRRTKRSRREAATDNSSSSDASSSSLSTSSIPIATSTSAATTSSTDSSIPSSLIPPVVVLSESL
jgi:hypothetical protein